MTADIPQPHNPATEPRPRRGACLAAAVIALTVTAVYWNSFDGQFIFDDTESIVDSGTIRRFTPLNEAIGPYFQRQRPLVDLSFGLNYQLGGLNPWGYHLVNLLIHLGASLALFGLVRRTLLTRRFEDSVGGAATVLAAAVALLWAVHPLNTQAVTYIVQRAESMMGMFFLLVLYCLCRGAGAGAAAGQGLPGAQAESRRFGPAFWYVLAVAACLLGMLSKPSMVVAPLVAIAYDRVFLAGSWRELLGRRWPVHAGLIGTLLLPAIMMSLIPMGPTAGFGTPGFTPYTYLLTQAQVIVHYLRLALLPVGQVLDYVLPAVDSWTAVWPQGIGLLALLAGTIIGLFRRPAIAFWGLWFFLTLAPTSSFVPVADAMVEHRMYLPLAAVVAVAVIGMASGAVHLSKSGKVSLAAMANLRLAGIIVAAAAIAALGALTIQRNRAYADPMAMWQDVLAKRPQNGRAMNWIGLLLARQGKLDEAAGYYRRAMEASKPTRFVPASYVDAGANLANVYFRQYLQDPLNRRDLLDETIYMYRRVVEIAPLHADAHRNLALALQYRRQEGDLEDAVGHARRAIELRPFFPRAYQTLGVVLFEQSLRAGPPARQSLLNDSIDAFEKSLSQDPKDPATLFGLGKAFHHLEDYDRSADLLGRAVAQNETAEGHLWLAKSLLARLDRIRDPGLLQRQGEEAFAHLTRSLQLQENQALAHLELGDLLLRSGQYPASHTHLARAAELAPRSALAQEKLGLVLERLGQPARAKLHYQRALEINPGLEDSRRQLEALSQPVTSPTQPARASQAASSTVTP